MRWPRALLALVPSSAAQSWSTVRSRYLFLTVGDDADPGEIPVSEMLRELGSAVQEAELVRTLPEGTLLYRARSHGRNDYPTTASELGAPPAQYSTISSRMSPNGIPMFYAARDRDTALRKRRVEVAASRGT